MTWANTPEKNRAFAFGESGKVRWDVVEYTRGVGLELGCGPVKLFPHFIGIDKQASDPLNGPSLVMDCSELPFLPEIFDFVFSSHLLEHIEDTRGALKEWWRVIKPGGHLVLYLPHRNYYPNIGEPGGNPDHKHDFAPGDIVDAMTAIATDWDMVVDETRNKGDEYSFFQVYRKQPGLGQVFSCALPKRAKTAMVFRPGIFGDALFASSILPHLKDQGYHVTVVTSEHGEHVLRHDPNIDHFITLGDGQIPDGFFTQCFEGMAPRYDRAINLVESIEKNMIAWPTEGRFLWPDAMRRKVFGGNYLEQIHELAGVPHQYRQRFYASEAEAAAAIAFKRSICGDRRLAVVGASGSTMPKFWPYLPRLAELLAGAGWHVAVLGDLRGMTLVEGERLTVLGMCWPMRKAMALALQADAVIGQETGLLNAVAMERMKKVVLLSHSTQENLTKHWVNTVSLAGAVPCQPCHRIHLDFSRCVRDETTGCAACQAAISPERVLEAVTQDGFGRAINQ